MKRVMTGTVAVAAVAVAAAWIAHSQQAADGASSVLQPSGPLIARGYTEAPSGTVMIANDPNGGSVLKELRIKEGQTVKRNEIIAVMGNYPAAEVNLKIAENNLLKTERMRDTILKGTRVVDIKLE